LDCSVGMVGDTRILYAVKFKMASWLPDEIM
jgi:hypothetical protein